MRIYKILLPVLVASIALFSFPFIGSQVANAEAPNLPTLEEFATALNAENGLAGVYAEGALALPVVQQPSGNAGFVSSQPGVVTEFAMAQQYNTVGLLAHNTLAGAEFSNLTIGQTLTLVYANGERKTYQITAIERYQALSPHSTTSDFLNLADTQQRLSATDLFNHVYAPGNRLVLQTCIANQGDFSWGRMFIVAESVTHTALPISTYAPMPSWTTTTALAAH